MKDEIIKILDNVYEAKSLIEINDMLNLHSADELKHLEDTINEMLYIPPPIILFEKKRKNLLFLSFYFNSSEVSRFWC